MRYFISCVIFVFAATAFAGRADAQLAPSPAASQSPSDISFTNHDVAMLLKATQDAQTSPKIRVDVLGKEPSQMPAYDNIVHYAGVDAGSGSAVIWIVHSPPKTKEATAAFLSAMELACMDTGFAGPQWKAIFDKVAAMDAALPAAVANRYQERLRLTARIQEIIDSYTSK
jgi:hypothetical protein